jgi:hypothetical protein
MAEQDFDPHINFPIPIKEIEEIYILITERTYHHLKKCIGLQENIDNLNKSYEDRILDMLLDVFNTSVYAMYHLFGGQAKELDYSSELISLSLRPQTYMYLKIYTYVICTLRDDIKNVDDSLMLLIERKITDLTIKKLQIELVTIKAKIEGGRST